MQKLALAVLLATGCSQGWERTDDAFLRECWGASQRGDGAYTLRFEAIVLAGTEGGIYARSRTCRDHRLNFARLEAGPDRQLEPAWSAAWELGPTWTVIRGEAVVRPSERAHEHLLRVRITGFSQLEIMSEADARQFVRFFDIG